MEKLSSIDLLELFMKVVFSNILIINRKFLEICKTIFLLFCTDDLFILISYAIIARECLVEENNRPEMIRIRALLCHSKVLPKQAFQVYLYLSNFIPLVIYCLQYYASEYNRYQEENATSDDVERFPEFQGVGDLPSFGYQNPIDDNDTCGNFRSHSDVIFRPTVNTDTAYLNQEPDRYLVPIINNQQIDDEMNNSARTTTESDVSQTDTKNQEPDRYLIPVIKNQHVDDEMR